MKLSQRECEVLLKVANGFSDKEIAHKLKISTRTIQTHMTSIFKKLDARNRAHAVAIYCSVNPRLKIEKGG